jgi:hypothetical protein
LGRREDEQEQEQQQAPKARPPEPTKRQVVQDLWIGDMVVNEALGVLAQIVICGEGSLQDLNGDVLGHVPGPAFRRVEADDAERVADWAVRKLRTMVSRSALAARRGMARNSQTGTPIRRYLKAPAVRLDNRLTNSKSNTRSAGLCCKEGLENLVPVFSIYSGSRILNGDQNMRGLLNNIGLNPQQARATDQAHCFNRICTQIKKNLLQLASIGNKLRQSLTQVK